MNWQICSECGVSFNANRQGVLKYTDLCNSCRYRKEPTKEELYEKYGEIINIPNVPLLLNKPRISILGQLINLFPFEIKRKTK